MNSDFRVGDFVVRPQRRLIEHGDESIHVKPKSMSVFECLVEADGAPVSRQTLFDTVWSGAEVTDDVLTKCIAELRKAFGDSAKESRVIETIPKLGFRLVLQARPLENDTVAPEQPSFVTQPSGPARSHKLRNVGLLVVLVLGALLFIDSVRSRLTESGVTLFVKAASMIAPHRLETEPGIAVLPFVNLSVDSSNEYFSDGISVELIDALASNDRLRVIADTSSFQFKGDNKNVKEIGRLLGVTHVVGGSVRKAGNKIRLHAQLIDAKTGELVWSKIYQRELTDIFTLQHEIAASITGQIQLAIGEMTLPRQDDLLAGDEVTARHTSNLEAYDLYLKGMQMLRSGSPLPIEQAAGYFDRAIALDPDYADAWAAKGLALYSLGRPGFGHPHIPASVYPDAIAAFRRALEIEPNHGMATGWLGVTLIVNDYQWSEGLRLMEKSLADNPNDSDLWSVYALHLRNMHMEGAEDALYKAFRLDPYGIIPVSIRVGGMQMEGRLLEAAALMEIILRKDREGYATNYQTAVLNILIGRLDAAEYHVQKAREVAHANDLSLDGLDWVIKMLRGEGALPPASESLERMKNERFSFFVDLGAIVEWEDEATIVSAFDLAIEQRLPEMRRILFGPKPPLMPEADWRRMKQMTGVTQFQQTL